jgi:hypothetical protein
MKNNKKYLANKNRNQAFGAMAGGAVAGAGVRAVVGGMGLTLGGGGVSISMAPVAAVGAVFGLAGYGLSKLFGSNSRKKRSTNSRYRKNH